ncbi:MAG: hypothetical protein PHZ24_14155 [Bacteroidales bacterium]|nr:hypothetical protein [Bacteroidales bacterium]
MKKTTLLLIAIFSLQLAYAQQHPEVKRTWHWYFGDGAGLDFSSGEAEVDTNGQLHTDEGCAAISDTNGNLLFYTSGSTVWNRNHQIMQNGTGLYGDWSAQQNSIIIPKPQNDNIYYIFTNDSWHYNINENKGVHYSIIDMSLDGGLGGIVEKNNFLMRPSHESLAAVHHANCEDVWVLCHKLGEEKFYAYLVTKNGVDTVPVISEIGNSVDLPVGAGIIKFSPNGRKVTSWNFWDWYNTGIVDTVELYDFDRNAGILFNRIAFSPDTVCLGFIFSPDNTKLYISGGGTTPNIKIYQYDLNTTNIENSKQLVYVSNYTVFYGDGQYSPIDSIIYFARAYTDTLAIIHNPNASGIACDFEDIGITLNGRNIQSFFPNFIVSFFNTDTVEYNCHNVTIAEVIRNQKFEVYPNPLYEQATINTFCKEITSYNLFDTKGKQLIKDEDYKLKRQYDSYLFTNKKLTGGIYILTGLFADKDQFNIKIVIN